MIDTELLRCLPKTELHLHLEGAVSAPTFADLARKHGVALEVDDPADLYRFADLASFLQMYGRVCEVVRDADDFSRMAYEALARVAASGGRYAEIFFSPAAHDAPYVTMLDGVIDGMRAAAVDARIESRVIPAHNRELGPERGEAFVELVLAHPRPEVIGIGLDYMENDPRPFAAMYARARAGGLHVTAHAGEVGPSAYVRDSIDVLGCERIDHGYHVVDDASLVERVRAGGTFFTCCPTTTTYTTEWRDLTAPDHAIRQMLDAGLAITLNSDDPGLMQTTLLDEYRLVVEGMELTRAQIKELCLNGVRAAWIDDGTKRAWLADWSAEIDRRFEHTFA